MGIAVAAVVSLVVLLIGGYGAGWAWTGFQTNQLWDWLHLLLLPVAFGLLPVWLRYSEHMSRTRKLTLAASVAASLSPSATSCRCTGPDSAATPCGTG